MALGQEDFGVLTRILAENIGEGSKAAAVEGTKSSIRGIRRFIVPQSLSFRLLELQLTLISFHR